MLSALTDTLFVVESRTDRNRVNEVPGEPGRTCIRRRRYKGTFCDAAVTYLPRPLMRIASSSGTTFKRGDMKAWQRGERFYELHAPFCFGLDTCGNGNVRIGPVMGSLRDRAIKRIEPVRHRDFSRCSSRRSRCCTRPRVWSQRDPSPQNSGYSTSQGHDC